MGGRNLGGSCNTELSFLGCFHSWSQQENQKQSRGKEGVTLVDPWEVFPEAHIQQQGKDSWCYFLMNS